MRTLRHLCTNRHRPRATGSARTLAPILTVPPYQTNRVPAHGSQLLIGAMTGATEKAVVVQDAEGVEQQVKFDYLILAVGSADC